MCEDNIHRNRWLPATTVGTSQVDKTEAHLQATLWPGGKDEARRALPSTGTQGADVLAEVRSRCAMR